MNLATFPLPDESQIPSVGKPFVIVHNWSTVVIQCQCEAKPVIVLNGLKTIATCPACQHRYAIMEEGRIGIGQLQPKGSGLIDA